MGDRSTGGYRIYSKVREVGHRRAEGSLNTKVDERPLGVLTLEPALRIRALVPYDPILYKNYVLLKDKSPLSKFAFAYLLDPTIVHTPLIVCLLFHIENEIKIVVNT